MWQTKKSETRSKARLIQAVVCAASMMCATSALADPPVTRTVIDIQDFPFSENDPCINSTVSGQMHYHSVFVDRSTQTTSDTTLKLHVTGEGRNDNPADTAKYQVASSLDNRFRSSSANFSFRFETRDHIIRQGNGMAKDDYFARSLVTFSSSSTKPSINRSTPEPCK